MYLVQTVGGQTWKYHIDHLRQMDDSPQHEQTTEEESTNKETINITKSNCQQHRASHDEFTKPVIEPAITTHRYPQTVHVPLDRLSYK